MAAAKHRPDVALFAEVAAIDQLSRNRAERVLPNGLSYAQFGVLNHFARRGGSDSPAQIAAGFQVTKGAMTNTLQKLEQQGFVAVADDAADGRRKIVTLTDAGREAHLAALSAMRPQMEALREAFDEAEFERALPFLKRLRAWLGEHR